MPVGSEVAVGPSVHDLPVGPEVAGGPSVHDMPVGPELVEGPCSRGSTGSSLVDSVARRQPSQDPAGRLIVGMKYDVIIVGAGSAGCVLANRLSEDPGRSVLLLEAGPDYPLEQLPDQLKYDILQAASEEGAAYNWSLVGQSTPQQPRQAHVARGKVTGGSSAINHQILLRGAPRTSTVGPPLATLSGATGRPCPTSAGWNQTPISATTFTAPTAPSPSGAISARTGFPYMRPSTRPASTPDSPTTRT